MAAHTSEQPTEHSGEQPNPHTSERSTEHATEPAEDGGSSGGEAQPAGWWTGRRWLVALLLVAATGLLVRVVYVLVVLDPVAPGFDAVWYALQAGSIEAGGGYVQPSSAIAGDPVPTASFPPAYPAYQAVWQALVGATPDSVRLSGLVPAAATIVLTGVLARRVLGPRAALLAAGVVALDPALVGVDGSAMSENLAVPLATAAVLLAHVLLADGLRLDRMLALGLVCGLAVLTRQDLLLLVPLLLLPAAVWAPRPGHRRDRREVGVRVGAAAAGLLVLAAVVVPWALRNADAVGTFAISTTSPSSALAGSNCDSTYAMPNLGSWDYDCVLAARPSEDASEVALVSAYQDAAFDHVRAHPERVPLVLAARQLRAWSWWDPADLARRDAEESRRYGFQLVARPIEALMVLVGAVGLVGLCRRRGREALVLWAPVAIVAISVSLSYGNPRFSSIAHPVLAIGVAWLASRLAIRLGGRRDARGVGGGGGGRGGSEGGDAHDPAPSVA